MYKAFHFKELEKFKKYLDYKLPTYKTYGKNMFDNQRKIIEESLEEFYINEKLIDGKRLMDEWFPKIKAHVFLSHSHTDIDDVYKFAGYLKSEFGLNCFIDSAVWGYADDLLKKLDDKHCYKSSTQTYIYEKRNITTSNVYLMLNNALYNMLDGTECIIFINTPSSVRKISDEMENRTYSPWIYSELNLINKIRERKPQRILIKGFEKRSFELNEGVKNDVSVAYDISEQLDALNELTLSDVITLNKTNANGPEDYLDNLYKTRGWIING